MKKTNRSENVDDFGLQQTFAYAFIGLMFLVILVLVSIGYGKQENGITIHTNTCPWNASDSTSITIDIDEYNIVTIDHEQVSDLDIPIRIKEKLASLPSDEILPVIIRPHGNSNVDIFSRIIDVINNEDISRIQVDVR